MIKVCHVSTVHTAFDGRIFEKQCVSLAQAGFDVTLVIPHAKNETVKGVKIVAVKNYSNRVLRILFAPMAALVKVIKSKAKIVEFHDPELMFLGVFLKLFGKKVIFDSHENVSSQIEGKSWIKNETIRKFVKHFYRLIERTCIFFFDRVISVTPEIVSFLSKKKGVLIRNYPIISKIESKTESNSDTDITTFIYVGGLTILRGVGEICEAFSGLDSNCELILAGPWESDDFRKGCLDGRNNITYKGMLSLAEVYQLISTADVGLATLHYQKNYLNSLPVKSFEYMANGLPLIMSDIPYWKENYEGFAKFVNPQDVKGILNEMKWMIDNPKERKALGERGRKAVMENYSWEAESKKLIAMYESLVS